MVVGGTGGDGETGHPGEDPHDVLRVHTELAEELDEDSYICGNCETGLHLDPGVEAPLTHDGERGAEVGLAAVRVSSSLQQESGTVPVLVNKRNEQRGLSLGVKTVNISTGCQEELHTLQTSS